VVGGSSGCSAYVAKPSWQADKHCHLRTVADVSSDGDPNTGVAVFDTVPFLAGQTRYVVGGTSAASPLVAGVVALSGQAVTPSFVYARHGRLNDVVGGSNATFNQNCGGDYLCVAKKGYDAPTGWGTPRRSRRVLTDADRPATARGRAVRTVHDGLLWRTAVAPSYPEP
jgi:subtilase family serine protease